MFRDQNSNARGFYTHFKIKMGANNAAICHALDGFYISNRPNCSSIQCELFTMMYRNIFLE